MGLCAFLLLAAAVAAVGGPEPDESRAGDSASVTVPRPPAMAVDTFPKGRNEVLVAEPFEHRLARDGLASAPAVLLGLVALAAQVLATGARPAATAGGSRWLPSGVALRAPPLRSQA